MFEVMDKLVEIETRKKEKTEQLKKIPNEDWTPILTKVVRAAIGYTVNVVDYRYDRCYTGILKKNPLDYHSMLGLLVAGNKVFFSVEEVIAVEVYFTKNGLVYDIEVGNV